jgi:hypothetical protein
MRLSRLLILLTALLLALAACAEEPPRPPADAVEDAADDAADAVEDAADDAADAVEDVADDTADRGAAGTWLVMLYSNADDEILEQDIFTDINEAELVGSSEQVTIVAQLDRYKGAFRGDGNWTGTKRLLITQDDDLTTINSEELADLGEADMADGQTLVDFVTWAAETYPADHYALIMSDHGMGWPGGWNDPAPAGAGPDGLALTADGDLLLLNEMSAALEEARSTAGIGQLELLGFDACLMGHVEVLAAMAPHARYIVASQEVEPSLGWAYASFLRELTDKPEMDGARLSKAIVDSYIDQDQRIVDDEARAAFAEETFGVEDSSAEQIAEEMGIDITLSAYDSATLPELLGALDGLVAALAEVDQDQVAEARTYAQSFENVFAEDGPAPYIDLGNFAELAQELDDENVDQAADALLDALKETVIAERHGKERPGATGLSIYFPSSELYEGEASGAETYAAVAESFAQGSLWENFLNFHYFGTELSDDTAPTGAASGPGASEISVAELTLSEEEIGQDGSTTVSTEVSGEHIGFIYAFTGYYDPERDTILVSDLEYIDAGESREVGGVFYPDWGDASAVEIEYDWEPIIYGIDDGTGNGVSFALLTPEDYGDTDESSTYTVDGMYRFAEGEQRYAQLYFKDGELLKVLGFSGQSAQGAPRVISPREGDSFTIYNELIKLNSDSDAEVEYFQEEGSTLTFGTQPWAVAELTAPAGDYVLGVQAEDLDGNLYEAYATVTVNE